MRSVWTVAAFLLFGNYSAVTAIELPEKPALATRKYGIPYRGLGYESRFPELAQDDWAFDAILSQKDTKRLKEYIIGEKLPNDTMGFEVAITKKFKSLGFLSTGIILFLIFTIILVILGTVPCCCCCCCMRLADRVFCIPRLITRRNRRRMTIFAGVSLIFIGFFQMYEVILTSLDLSAMSKQLDGDLPDSLIGKLDDMVVSLNDTLLGKNDDGLLYKLSAAEYRNHLSAQLNKYYDTNNGAFYAQSYFVHLDNLLKKEDTSYNTAKATYAKDPKCLAIVEASHKSFNVLRTARDSLYKRLKPSEVLNSLDSELEKFKIAQSHFINSFASLISAFLGDLDAFQKSPALKTFRIVVTLVAVFFCGGYSVALTLAGVGLIVGAVMLWVTKRDFTRFYLLLRIAIQITTGLIVLTAIFIVPLYLVGSLVTNEVCVPLISFDDGLYWFMDRKLRQEMESVSAKINIDVSAISFAKLMHSCKDAAPLWTLFEPLPTLVGHAIQNFTNTGISATFSKVDRSQLPEKWEASCDKYQIPTSDIQAFKTAPTPTFQYDKLNMSTTYNGSSCYTLYEGTMVMMELPCFFFFGPWNGFCLGLYVLAWFGLIFMLLSNLVSRLYAFREYVNVNNRKEKYFTANDEHWKNLPVGEWEREHGSRDNNRVTRENASRAHLALEATGLADQRPDLMDAADAAAADTRGREPDASLDRYGRPRDKWLNVNKLDVVRVEYEEPKVEENSPKESPKPKEESPEDSPVRQTMSWNKNLFELGRFSKTPQPPSEAQSAPQTPRHRRHYFPSWRRFQKLPPHSSQRPPGRDGGGYPHREAFQSSPEFGPPRHHRNHPQHGSHPGHGPRKRRQSYGPSRHQQKDDFYPDHGYENREEDDRGVKKAQTTNWKGWPF